jgi:hypothetical protein
MLQDGCYRTRAYFKEHFIQLRITNYELRITIFQLYSLFHSTFILNAQKLFQVGFWGHSFVSGKMCEKGGTRAETALSANLVDVYPLVGLCDVAQVRFSVFEAHAGNELKEIAPQIAVNRGGYGFWGNTDFMCQEPQAVMRVAIGFAVFEMLYAGAAYGFHFFAAQGLRRLHDGIVCLIVLTSFHTEKFFDKGRA